MMSLISSLEIFECLAYHLNEPPTRGAKLSEPMRAIRSPQQQAAAEMQSSSAKAITIAK